MTEGLHRFYGGNDLHFLTFSCYRRQPWFGSAARCDLFLQILERVRRRYRLVVLGYVVIPEHVHLLVSEPQRETLSTAIQALKLGVVRSLQSARGEAVVATAPRSRKGGETWGTPVRGTPVRGTQFEVSRARSAQPRRTFSGKRGFMTSTCGRRRRELKSSATYTAIPWPEDW